MTENIVYHQNFYDTIREAKDAEELRGILRKVETEIKERVGNNHYEFYSKASNEEKEAIEDGEDADDLDDLDVLLLVVSADIVNLSYLTLMYNKVDCLTMILNI